LAEIAEEKKDKLTFIKVNADESQEIVKNLNVEELPTLILYKNGKRVYTNIGLITKADLLKIIENSINK
jgi:thioredoxin 1